MSAEFSIIADPTSWRDVWGRLDRPSVLAGYEHVHAAALLEPGAVAEAAVMQWREGVAFFPYLRRPIPGANGLWDLVSAYDFGGLWFSALDADSRLALATAFGDAFARHAQQSGVVSAFMRVHPFIPVETLAAAGYDLKHHQDNVVVELNAPLEEIRGRYARARRKQVRQGWESGLTLAFSDDIDGFVALYHENMHRMKANPFYLFPVDFFAAIRSSLLLAEARAPDGEVCARHLYLPDGETLFAFLCHADAKRLGLRPNDFVYDAMIAEAHRRGFSRIHFGGGAENLYKYKQSFSPERIAFYHARCIFLLKEYNYLLQKKKSMIHDFNPGLFFPAYRYVSRATE